MGRRNQSQGQLFYEFRLDDAVPDDHLVRKIGALLDLSWVYAELAPYYSEIGRPSIDPVLMIRMLIIGYVFAIRSERQICREVQVNLAYRWFCELGLEDAIPDHSAFSRARNEDLPSMKDTEALTQVERLITDFENRIARQREVVASAFQKGHETDIAISMLRALEASLSAFERHRQHVLSRQRATPR